MPNVAVLSDGCLPTEEIYLMRSASTQLASRQNINFKVIQCKRQKPSERILKSSNILIAFRTLPAEWIQHLERNKGQKRLIYVLDDDLRAAGQTSELPIKYKTRISSFASLYLNRLLELSDDVILTSTHLMDAYSDYNPIRLNPTALKLPEKAAEFDRKKISIAYHATSSHKSDLERIHQPLVKALDSFNCSFESLIGKDTPQELQTHSAVKSRSPKSYSAFRRFQALATRNICLAPLFDTAYNNGKSWIKFLDASSVGAVGIYSKRAPYTEVVEHGVNGLLANDTPEDWESCLFYLLENPEKAQIMAQNALATAYKIGSFKRSYRFWLRLLSQ